MNKFIVKSVAVGLIAVAQWGVAAPVMEAASLHSMSDQQNVQLSRHDNRHDRDRQERLRNERQREHDRRMRAERARHERELRRHRGESQRDWHRRQARENDRHERALRDIGAVLIGIVIGTRL